MPECGQRKAPPACLGAGLGNPRRLLQTAPERNLCGASGSLGEGGGLWGPPRALFSSRRIGGLLSANWQVKLSIKEKSARPGQGGGRKNLGLVGKMAKYRGGWGGDRERERERDFHKVLGL